ncbi:MAG: zinc ribbon domain-containing protein [Planctomycetaceae bacterium]|nr:zinc ribbon domain-containing protein [Planctomycetaceae bacterium]
MANHYYYDNNGQKQGPVSGQQPHCTNCGAVAVPDAVVCFSCGARPQGHRKFCAACGVSLNPEQVICIRCGVAVGGICFGFCGE